MKTIFKNLNRVYKIVLKLLFDISLTKTLYINFKKLPFDQAKKLPIYIYKGVKFDSLKGDIVINSDISRAMIKIGYNIDGHVLSSLKVHLFINGKLIFNGPNIISRGTVLQIYGTLNIGKFCTIGSGCFIKSLTDITINDYSRITYNCTVLDSDLHYVKNIETGVVKKNRAPIIIGRNCWINAGSVIAKGTILPDYSITARNSFLNKDYSEFGPNMFFLGAPAKPKSSNIQRIFSLAEEQRLTRIFNESDKNEIVLPTGLFEEDDDFKFLFK